MTSHQLTEDSQVILLLCGRFGRDIQSSPEPLGFSEYNRLAAWLTENSLQPANLLSHHSTKMLQTASLANLGVDRIESLLNRGASLAMAVETWANNGLWVMTRNDETYPQMLADKLKHASPPILYGAGDQDLLSRGGMAIVGSRDVDEEGLFFANRVAVRCARQGVQVVSGGARGIDREAMISALDEGGEVVGVLAHGLMQAARSKRYREAILKEKIVLVSAFNHYAGFNVGNAMARNKHIYVLSDWALAVSATLEKGGTWTGAIENMKNRWTPLFVWMNEDAPQGNHALINKGAVPVRDEDILRDDIQLSEWFDSNRAVNDQETIEQLSLL